MDQRLARRAMMKGFRRDETQPPSDEKQGVPQPPLQHDRDGVRRIALPRAFDAVAQTRDFLAVLDGRVSRRQYSQAPLTLQELSFLLWYTQGVRQVIGRVRKATLRTVPSAGARHPFETYLFVSHAADLPAGLYHYLALSHELEYLGPVENQAERVTAAFWGQRFVGEAPVTFVWTVTPYRTEWRYGDQAARFALIDAGHVCENLYLACEAIGCGACGIGAFLQEEVDALLRLPADQAGTREEEFAVYAAAVGHAE